MLDLAEATSDTFAPWVGTAFAVAGVTDPLVLTAVRPHAAGPQGRGPFSLDFAGPMHPRLAQQTLRLEHAELGSLELFVVPVGGDDKAARYEAVFG
jgi:hypothetical protein